MINKKNFSLIFLFLSNLFFFEVKSDSKFDLGKKIFLAQGNCATCHTLADAKSNGQIGPNLNQIRPDISRVLSAVTNGIGVMPAYDGVLSLIEIESVSHYVAVSSSE
jgi:cytochrome c6